jgi:hypothetical protein
MTGGLIKMRFSVTLAIIFLSLTGCSETPALHESLNDKGVPTWVGNGSSILKTKNERYFNGVGSASMMGDFSLRTAEANRLARQEMTRIIGSYLEIVSRDYIASGKAAAAGFSEQNILKYMDKVSQMDLSTVQVVGHWKDNKSKIIYAITQMDMQKVRQLIENLVSSDAGLKAYLDSNGSTIFDRIANKE